MKLTIARNERIEAQKKYNNYLEELYTNVRMVKHDSENILISLKDSIDSGDINLISKVFNMVVKNSTYQISQISPDYNDLENVEDSALRSLINTKLFEAKHLGIEINIEIPELIARNTMNIRDILTIVSEVLENAIILAQSCENPYLYIAIFNENDKQYFIVDNSTVDKMIDVKDFFRDIQVPDNGLKLKHRFIEKINRYENLIYSIKSNHYKLRQILEIERWQ